MHSSNITEAGRERIPTARTGNFALWKSFFARANGYVTRSDDSVTLTNESFNNSAKPNMFKDVTLGMSSNSDLALDWVLEEDSIFGVLNTDNRELLLKKFMREILRDPNVPFYYGNSDTENQNIRNAINNNNVEDSDYTVKELQLKYRDAIQNQIKIETRKLRNAGVAQGDFDLDGVLALLRKNGQVVKYADLYGNQTNPSEVGAGELLVNGAEMLFELLDSSENTEGMADIMRYLLYLYSGKNYGVTSFDDMILGELSPMNISGGNIEEKIWIALKNLGYNDFAAAAVLGNLSAESGGINSHYLEVGKIAGHNHESYTNAVNNGTYTNFANDGAGYGIAQWTYHTRKEGLLKYVRSVGKGIDDEDAQIEYLIAEIAGTGPAVLYASRELYDRNGYTPEDWENADNVATAALAFCWTYENPAAAYAHENKRITETQKYYDRFSGRTFMLGEDYTGTEGDKIVAAASNILEHTKSHRYSYVNSVPKYKRDGGPGVNNMPSERGICCASYVAWVLVESGVVSADYIDSLYFRGASEIGSGLSHIFPRVNKSEMQAGDIVVWGGHTQIFAGYDSSGNMWWYNGGVEDEIPPVKHSSYNAFSYFGNDCYILRPVQQ